MHSLSLLSTITLAALAAAQEPTMKLKTWVDAVPLQHPFNPIIPAYWTGLPHHRRIPFDIAPDGKTGYFAYLNADGKQVHLEHVDPNTMKRKNPDVTIPNVREAGGLVAHNHGFALLGNEPIPSTTENAPPGDTPVPAIYRYRWGKQVWKSFVAGPDLDSQSGHMMAPDMNGDLVWSEEAQLYGAYFVVTAYDGSAKGHFGDSIQYVKDDGKVQQIPGASSSWGCSHNTGIAFEAADQAPFASICAEDQGAIWLNTETQGMGSNGVKIANSQVQNGGGGEAMGGMSGSYSSLARFVNSTEYIFAYVSQGAIELKENEWMGAGYTQGVNRTNGRRTAMAIMSDKATLLGEQASSKVGAVGDGQVNWVSETEGPDRSNAHVAVFDDQYALITWEEAADPKCENIAMGCAGTFTGTYFQLVNKAGKKLGAPIVKKDVYVAGDMVTTNDGRICWPYINMEWSLENPGYGGGADKTATKISFACMSLV